MDPSFTFVHTAGCMCASRVGGTYAHRLSVARSAMVALIDPALDEEAQLDAFAALCERIPEGSCLGWLDDAHRGQGWPSAHRDYHLLALYRAARRHADALVCFRRAEADGLRMRGTREADPIGFDWCERKRDETLAAEKRRDMAEAALVAALVAAPWGAQPDGSFVTRRTAHQIASGRYVLTLHAPGKGGPLATYTEGPPWYTDGSGGALVLRTREEARAIREAGRAEARAAEAAYAVKLGRAAEALTMYGGSLPYSTGQEWGTIALPTGERVSARGALRQALALYGVAQNGGRADEPGRAKNAREYAEKILRESLEHLGLSYDDARRERLVLTLRGVEIAA